MSSSGPVRLPDAVSLKDGKESAHQQMLDICRKALPGWEQLTLADVEFTTVSGGISNVNAKLTPKATTTSSSQGTAPAAAAAQPAQQQQQQRPVLDPVMFKVFGDKTDQIIDREAEKVVVVALGEQGFGPKVLALFANGRIEQWLNCICLDPHDMNHPQLVPRIARHLRRFHSIQVDLPRNPHTPWGVIRDWLKQAQQLQFSDPAKQAAYEAIDFAALQADVDETQAVCALTSCPLVFGHNDLLSGNILVLQPAPGIEPGTSSVSTTDKLSGRIVFIDYEYGAYTYRDFDIGNHFTEYAGFDGNYDRYPTKEQQELFFRYYMAEDAALTAAPGGSSSKGKHGGLLGWFRRLKARATHKQQQQPTKQQQPHGKPVHRLGSLEEPTPPCAAAAAAAGSDDTTAAAGPGGDAAPPLPSDVVDRLSASANVWALASHLYWGIWAIIQACNSPIDFDYLAFHHTRINEYRRRKQAWHADAHRLFGDGGGQQMSSSSGAGGAAGSGGVESAAGVGGGAGAVQQTQQQKEKAADGTPAVAIA